MSAECTDASPATSLAAGRRLGRLTRALNGVNGCAPPVSASEFDPQRPWPTGGDDGGGGDERISSIVIHTDQREEAAWAAAAEKGDTQRKENEL